jgi:hypothetical protein
VSAVREGIHHMTVFTVVWLAIVCVVAGFLLGAGLIILAVIRGFWDTWK